MSLVEPKRLSINEYYISMAILASRRSTCARRRVGCILVDEHDRVISIGYNGVASGLPHCIYVPCYGATQPSGEGLDLCEAIHAEQSAVAACSDVRLISKAYCTASPCLSCVKLLLATQCKTIIFAEEYPHHQSKRLWIDSKRKWVHYEESIVAELKTVNNKKIDG